MVAFYNDSGAAWGDVYLRQFDAAGQPIDGDRLVNADIAYHYQSEPAIADLGNGNFVVAWRSDQSQDGNGSGIYQQLFGSTAELPRQTSPNLADFTGSVSFAENAVNAGLQIIDPAVSLSDVDSANFNGGRLDLYLTSGGAAEDQLGVVAGGPIGLAGNVVSYNGNAIGTLFIQLAQDDMRQHLANLPDRDLAYFKEGSRHFDDYVEAVGWAQDFARHNRALMMRNVVAAARRIVAKPFVADVEAVNCHHNYVQRETHFGHDIFVTRKGAVAAHRGQLGIIPGSMGAKSFIVRGLGNEQAFCSCSHGAGRTMSRTQAKKVFTVADQVRATAGVECRKDAGVIDEIPMAYKDIDAVMAAQSDLVEVVHTLRQVICVKG